MLAAVEASSSKTLPPEVFGLNRDVISHKAAQNLRPFIQDYKVVAEEVKNNVIRVEAKVVTRSDKLSEELERWGILFSSQKRPKILLSRLEERGGRGSSDARSPSAVWTERVFRRFRGLGYTVERGMAASGRPAPAKGVKLEPRILIQGSFALRGEQAISAELAAIADPALAELGAVRGNFSLKDGPELAAGLLVVSLLERSLPAWRRQIGEGLEYEVTVTGFGSYKPYKEFRDYLASGREGVRAVRESAFAPGRVTFTVTYEGSGGDLVKLLTKQPYGGVKLIVSSVSSRNLEFEAK
jgi:hypothetical protein